MDERHEASHDSPFQDHDGDCDCSACACVDDGQKEEGSEDTETIREEEHGLNNGRCNHDKDGCWQCNTEALDGSSDETRLSSWTIGSRVWKLAALFTTWKPHGRRS